MNEAAEFSITIEGASILVKMRGEIDMDNAPQLLNYLSALRGDTIVDCSGVDFMDSTGIGALIQAHRAFQAHGDRLTLRNLPMHIRRIFEVAGVLEILDID